MPQIANQHSQSRISGQILIDELIRNMELGRLEMGYSVLLPCIFSVYLHPDDYARLRSIEDLIREDAKRALTARMAEWNRTTSLFRRGSTRKPHKIARDDWWIELFADTEGAVPPGDVEIHSELNDVPQPGYRGVKTTLIGREPSVTSVRTGLVRNGSRANSQTVFAEIHYQDDSGPQTYFITQNEIRAGRGGEDLWMDLQLYTNEEVSREHLILRRNPSTGRFSIVDQSRNGTWVNGRRVPPGVEQAVPDQAEIVLAQILRLSFQVRR